jgi:hypothetical protein
VVVNNEDGFLFAHGFFLHVESLPVIDDMKQDVRKPSPFPSPPLETVFRVGAKWRVKRINAFLLVSSIGSPQAISYLLHQLVGLPVSHSLGGDSTGRRDGLLLQLDFHAELNHPVCGKTEVGCWVLNISRHEGEK